MRRREKKNWTSGDAPPPANVFFLAFTCLLNFSCLVKRRQKLLLYKLLLQLKYFKLPQCCLVLASSQRAMELLFPNLFLVIQINSIHVSWGNFFIDPFFFIFSRAKQAQKQFVVSLSRTVSSCILITAGEVKSYSSNSVEVLQAIILLWFLIVFKKLKLYQSNLILRCEDFFVYWFPLCFWEITLGEPPSFLVPFFAQPKKDRLGNVLSSFQRKMQSDFFVIIYYSLNLKFWQSVWLKLIWNSLSLVRYVGRKPRRIGGRRGTGGGRGKGGRWEF